MKRILLLRVFVAATAAALLLMLVLGQSQAPQAPFFTTPSLNAFSSSGITLLVRQPDSTYTQLRFGITPPYGLLSSIESLAKFLSGGAEAALTLPAGPANVGLASQYAALGDFKGDGSPGVAYVDVHLNRNKIYVYLGTPAAVFSGSTLYTIGAATAGVITADFNGDGKADIAVAYKGSGASPGGVAILLNKGDGTFNPAVTYAAGASPISIAALDLNHDGHLDLAVADNGSSPGKVYVLLGTGTGTFTAGGNYTVGNNPLSVTIADFSGDANPDLAVTAADNTVTVLLGAGNGTFTAGSSYSTSQNPQCVAAGDFNKDGKMDLVVANTYGQSVSIFLGRGDGSFQAGPSYWTSYEPEGLIITDYNGDGNLDIIQGTGDARGIGPGVDSEDIDILLGNGDGTFQGATTVPGPQATGSFLATGDFSGDGKTDAILNDKFGGNLYLFAEDGDGGFQTPATINALATGGQTGPSGAATGDFNGDSKLDLAVAESFTGKVAVLLNSASGLQLSGRFSSGGAVPGPIVAADFNGDSKLDLAVVNAPSDDRLTAGNLTVFFGAGNGTFQLAHTYSAGSYPSSVAVADVNGDGKPDLVVTNMSDPFVDPRVPGSVYVFLNDGSGGFQTPSTMTVGTYPFSVWIGDLNADGKPDLIVASNDSHAAYTLSVLLGSGNGTFQPPASVSTEYGPSGVAIRDFNGDGKADLVVSHCCGATDMTYLQGNGDGTFQTEAHFNGGKNSFAVAPADLNGDGKPDLIVGGTTALSITPLLNNVRTALAIAKTHTGTFSAGQSGATYSVVVSNTGTDPTNGTVSVTDTLPSGLTLVSMAGTGWSCSGNSCTRSDVLNSGAAYPAITVTVNVAAGAASLVTNQVSVSGGGAATASASDPTTILQPPAVPALTSPANGAGGVVTAPLLTWNAAVGAASYDVYLGASSSPPFAANTTGTSYAPGPLSLGAAYTWQVVARNAVGSTPSAVWSFTTSSVPAVGLRFVPVTPCRVADTRRPAGAFGGPSMTAGSARPFTVPQSGCGIPQTAMAYSLNVTVVPPGRLSYLTLWPTGQGQPFVSTLNSWGGDVVANAAIVPAGTDGAVSVYVTNPTEVILDINGYFDSSTSVNASSFYPVTPCRVADTRGPVGPFGGPTMSQGQARDFALPLSGCGIPAAAGGYSLNFTVVPPGYLGYLSTWPAGQAQPNVSTLNSWKGKVVANAAIVPRGNDESISVYASNPTDVILDVNGYFGQAGAPGGLKFYPVAPCRVVDTRNADGPLGGPKMAGASTRSFTIPASGCNIPTTAAAYSVNVTVVPDGRLSYLSTWPAGSGQPFVSTLNSWDGSVVANAAIVPSGTNEAISVYVTNPTHVIVDINGYFAE
jgi:uncharacterized repeat protein (TIGR01451 family)